MATYICKTCDRNFQRKLYYNRHVLLCEIMSKSVKERQQENEERADTPTVRVLYDVILELTGKMNKMEQRLQELSKWVDVKKRKINILEWLNGRNANGQAKGESEGEGNSNSFETFLLQLNVERQHLDYLFQNDYTSTILQILQSNLPLVDTMKANVIKAFEQKTNVLYTYTQDQWVILDDTLLKKLMYSVDKKLLGEFIKWQSENVANMGDDDFAMKYAVNVKKLMGGNLTREQISSRVKIDLYKYLKVCLKNLITECEFV